MKVNIQIINLALIGYTLMSVAIPLFIGTPSAIAQEENPIAALLQEIVPQLRQTTTLPILLPSELTPDSQQLYAHVAIEIGTFLTLAGLTQELSKTLLTLCPLCPLRFVFS
ncbi:MAG: hypothetical protein V7L20_05525 [Nostoc sp.]|uniref:hypothetical protein n=1 Tax=Nostoc sp. TaxID=1180 RepID=UPI002FF5A156